MNKYKKIIPIVILVSLFFFSIYRMNNQHCCNHLKPMITTKSNSIQSLVKKENKETKKPKKQRYKYSR